MLITTEQRLKSTVTVVVLCDPCEPMGTRGHVRAGRKAQPSAHSCDLKSWWQLLFAALVSFGRNFLAPGSAPPSVPAQQAGSVRSEASAGG
jgi:hypothetical protein